MGGVSPKAKKSSAKSGEEWAPPPKLMVTVSPQCSHQIGLFTLPPLVLQGTAVSNERISQHLPEFVAGLGGSLPQKRSLKQLNIWQRGSFCQTCLNGSCIHVEKGYRIQFGSPPPPFNGVLPTLVGPEQALVMEQEVKALLRKKAIVVVPPHDRESGFYSWYFIVPTKDEGLPPILDLRLLNRTVMCLKFRMLTLKQVVSQIRSKDWFVTIDLKDAYFHISILPQHRKFLKFAFGGEAYQYRVLPFGLALSPRTLIKCVDAALTSLRLQGIRILNYIDDWLILAQSEQLAARHREVVLAHIKELGLRLNTKKSVLSPVQRTTYLGVVWDSTTMQNANDGRTPYWLGSDGHPALWSVERSPSHVAHQLHGDAGCVLSIKILSPRPERPSFVGAHRQHSGGLLYQSPKRSVVTLPEQAGTPDPLVGQGKLLSLRAVHISGHLNQGTDVLSRQGPRPGEWRLHPKVVELIWTQFGQVDLFATQETSTLYVSSASTGCIRPQSSPVEENGPIVCAFLSL
ncbi:Transposon Ty3-G Gag-Pol polyprotein [Labeo rohita]|uniref:ribonuclease H n=1 Tax=Labeo rohita TaxID=84645 RepID=A0ABQ8L3B0_LABRO|nr:Transposon Ty3-G Gag-Pol polyprotein [Labeo rohita]